MLVVDRFGVGWRIDETGKNDITPMAPLSRRAGAGGYDELTNQTNDDNTLNNISILNHPVSLSHHQPPTTNHHR